MGEVRIWETEGEGMPEKKYFSAEFLLANPKIYYQFRLRQTSDAAPFVVVKNDSQALECLHQGETVALTLHFEDNDLPAERREVKITAIEDAASFGLSDHVKVSFSL